MIFKPFKVKCLYLDEKAKDFKPFFFTKNKIYKVVEYDQIDKRFLLIGDYSAACGVYNLFKYFKKVSVKRNIPKEIK